MLKQNSTGNVFLMAKFLISNGKTLERPGRCSVLGAGHYPRTGLRGGVDPISDFVRLAGMFSSINSA